MDIALTILGYLGTGVFVLVLLAGALSTLLGIPGTFIIVAAAVVYSAVRHWEAPTWPILVLLLALSVIAEVSDNLVSAAGVKKLGGSPKGMLWALVGGLVGAFALGAVLGPPLGLLGAVLAPIVGGVTGGFVGGYWYELRQGRPKEEAQRAGLGAVLGRLAGVMGKTIIAAVMVAVTLVAAF